MARSRGPSVLNLQSGQACSRDAQPNGTQAPRILLVDDELSVQKLLGYPLRKEGYDVVPALDGREAIEACATSASTWWCWT